MVGLLGCGCCGTSPNYCNNGFISSLSDDFSPDFEADWESTTGLIAATGTAQCNTVTPSPFGNYSSGRAVASMQKQSEAGTISARVKLFAWPTSSSFGSINSYQARVGVYDVLDTNWIRVSAIRIDSGSWYAIERTSSGINFTTVIPTIPAAGDVFGFDCETWFEFPAGLGTVKNTTTKVIVNGSTVYTESGTLVIDPCDFDMEMYIKQPAINLPGSWLVRLDDYTGEAL